MVQNNSGLTALSQSLADAVQTAGESTVTVDARRRYPASGVIIASGIVLTSSHAVQEDEIKVTLPDGTELKAELLGRDPQSDLAVLKLAEAKGKAASVNEEPQVGQFALALGRPGSEGVQASLGIVSAIGGPLRSRHGGLLESYVRTDAIPYPGFSGGPLADAEGRVLGINTSGLGMGVSLTIPAKLAWKIAAAIQEHGGVKRGYLGVRSQLVEVDEAGQKALKREQASGLLVMGVEKDSPAIAAGLIVGDIIVGLAGEAVSDHDELLAQMQGDVVGKATDVEVLRGGKPHTLKVTMGEAPQSEERHGKHHRGGGRHGRHGQRGWGRGR
jgi:S1-C subfamily serine protease